MGNKQALQKSSSSVVLNPREKRKLTVFLEQNKKGSTNFTFSDIKRLWNELLVPDLVASYANYIFNYNNRRRETVGTEEFVCLYSELIRGSPDEKVAALVSIIGSHTNPQGLHIIHYQSLTKYLSDLLESYFVGLKSRNDHYYQSWTHKGDPHRSAIEKVVEGFCSDLQRSGDEVRIDMFERWFLHNGLVNTLHAYVLGSLYNLEPEQESSMIPLAIIKSKKTSIILDLSHVVYLNSFLPSESRAEWRSLYSMHSHGESFSKLVASIINEGPLLVVLQTNSDNMFGGFISTNVNLSPRWVGSEDSFLFKLYPFVEIYPGTGYNDHYAYLNSHQTTMPNGLGMGGQYSYWGFWIDSHFGIGECSESCTTYKNYKMLDTHKKFHIKSLEVWAVHVPPATDEEKGERRSGTRVGGPSSALDLDPTTAQILEMAGRTMHSKGFRDE